MNFFTQFYAGMCLLLVVILLLAQERNYGSDHTPEWWYRFYDGVWNALFCALVGLAVLVIAQ